LLWVWGEGGGETPPPSASVSVDSYAFDVAI